MTFGFTQKGKANIYLAWTSLALARGYQIPIFTQKDVAVHLRDRDDNVNVFVADQENEHISTLALVKIFEREAKFYKWKNILLVAAPPHIRRCRRDLEKFGFNVLTIENYIDLEEKNQKKIKWYNKTDPQFWARNPIIWWSREIILRIMPYWLYRKLAA
jgi:hypothetical protein